MWKVILFWMSITLSGWTAVSSDTATTYMEAVKACMVEVPVKLEELEKLKNRQPPESTPTKCLLACMFRKGGFIDDEGMFSPENVVKRTETIYPGDAAKLEQTQNYIEACKKVNDAAVSDGKAGCERAALLFQCTTDYKTEGWTDEEVKLDFVKVAMKCNKDIPVEPQHLISLQKKVMPDDPASACLMACAYKKTGMMDDQGMYSLEGAAKLSDKYYSDNPTKLENSRKFSEFCKKVNDETVSDGEKGCDRAVLLFRCFVDNADKYGIKI